MHFHHHGYVSEDPRTLPAAGVGLNRPTELPDEMDVLIVGTGPAGMIAAAQLSMYPNVHTRIIDRRPHRLEIGQADGIQARSVETFQAFGFANEITDEAYRITEMCFWKPNPENPAEIIRTGRAPDDPNGISEFPHLIVNQARVLDHFAAFMKRSPSRMEPDFGWEFVSLEVADENAGEEYPVSVTLRRTCDVDEGTERVVKAKYVVGCDGARSKVRKSIGRVLAGDAANHAWGVMDVLANTDFPDIRTKCAIQSSSGSILLIPREGGHLFRMYVDLGVVPEGDNGKIRETSIEQVIAKANEIMAPYYVDVKNVAWSSVYEVGHRVTNHFDDASDIGGNPRVFITGDACHTHSAKAGQGMNVSMQDGFNIAWKLGAVLSGQSPSELLKTYSAERQVVAQNLIDFDKEWSTLMAKPAEEFEDPKFLEEFYVKTAEFPAGFMTQYTDSLITFGESRQELATGYPLGKRFKSELVSRVSDGNPIHLGHQATADGRWRVYVFADAAGQKINDWAAWWSDSDNSPQRHTPAGDTDALFDVRVIYPRPHAEISIPEVPSAFKPVVGAFDIEYWEKVYGVSEKHNIFADRGIGAKGAVVVVRPDQYVAGIFGLNETEALAEFMNPIFGG
ncbi:FAD-binding monooxygenase [Corynebacterium epidermidicanis]|uniref:2-polyprenyl-6-methoxyphenol hydroxylase-like oxidoreductase n=1 Tax=Corynebacterium epidermidicanis TaxID=1050174 RepID=A0A0G3GUN1_9CORY|nr:FAD-binding monooxygenase [Corynebacterium epidermidicanis]AKK04210.1 2-polyprenyl-6-methoxyphenol hydroxylase-like oxidoreductase [Corynebacterium epidermidicanis]